LLSGNQENRLILDDFQRRCPECDNSATEITGGKDFTITNIEAEVATAS
jgi:Zn finger protein HypA/HybF involved in hydrogenase expression